MDDDSNMAAILTENGVRTLTQPGYLPDFKPLLQIIDLKNISKPSDGTAAISHSSSVAVVTPPQPSSSDRYRLILSDGHHFCQGCFLAQLNDLARTIGTNNIIRINEYFVSSIKGHLICGIISCDIIDSNMTELIGSPVNIDERYRLSQWENRDADDAIEEDNETSDESDDDVDDDETSI